MRKTLIILVIIFLIGFFLRFFRLGEVPYGFHKDEAFLGYNAYSILATGKDISGNFLPIHLKSFLYSPAGYSYLSIIPIYFFGLNPFSVRFSSALFGSLTVLVTFFLVLQLFVNNKWRFKVALCSSFFLAISPWHINLSRTATENVIVVFFVTLGVFLYLLWVRNKNAYLLFVAIFSFMITLVLYQAPRAFLPMFLPVLFVLFLKEVKDKKNKILPIIFFVGVIIIPLFLIITSKELSLRIRTVSIFATAQTQLIIDEKIRDDGVIGVSSYTSRFFHNKLGGYFAQILENYFSHLSYDFLFTDKAFPDRYRVPSMGLVYLFELPFLLLGIWQCVKKIKKENMLLLFWLFLAPVGTSLTFDDIPNLQRTLIVFPSLSIIMALGFHEMNQLLEQNKKFMIYCVLSIIVIMQIAYYLHEYYFHLNRYRPWYRNDGYKELVLSVNSLLPKYKKAVITDRESSPTIFFLFFGKYDPKLFQQETHNTAMKDFDRIWFNKYEFSQEECPLRTSQMTDERILSGDKNIIFVNSGLCPIPKGTFVLKEIQRGDSSVAFRILSVSN